MKRIWPILGYLGIVVLVFGRVLIPPDGQLIFGDDIHLTYYFFKKFLAQSVWQGIVPWWNPYAFAGQPMMAHPQALLMFYPLNWLFVILPTNVAVSIYLAIHILLAMVGMYGFLRRFVSSLPAWSGGVIFGLSGFFMARIWAGHMDMIAAAAWVPWVFGAFWSVLADGKRRSMIVSGVFLALQLLAGYQTMALFTLEAVGVALLFHSVHRRSFLPAVRVAISVGIALGLSAVQLVPEQEFVAHSIRTYALGYSWTSGFSMILSMFTTGISPFLFGDAQSYTGQWPNFAEYAFYIGRVALVLGIVSFFLVLGRKIKGVVVLPLLSIAGFSLWVSSGTNAPVDLLWLLWKLVPLYHAIRLPSRHLILFVFAASALAAFSLDTIRQRAVRIILVVGIVIELLPFARHFIELRPVPESRHDPSLVALLKADTALFRILPNFGVWLPQRSNLDFESSLTYQIFSATGYDPSILRNYYDFVDAASGHETGSFLEHNVQVPYLPIPSAGASSLNIKYVLTPGSRGLTVTRLDDTFPRFFTVTKSIVTTPAQVAEHIRKGDVDLKTTVLLSQGPEGEFPCDRSSRVDVRDYGPNRITLSVDAVCDTILVSSEVFYPGWEAYVDGEKTRIFEGNMAFRTLFVKSGKHTIVYQFFPYSFVVGGAISFITILVCFVLVHKRHTTHE